MRRLLMLSRSRSSRTILRLRLRLSSLLCFFLLYVCMVLLCCGFNLYGYAVDALGYRYLATAGEV